MAQIEKTSTNSEKKRSAILKGFAVGIITGLLSFFSISLARENILLNVATQFVIPFALTYRLTGNWLNTFTLITITDTFLSFQSIFFISSLGLPQEGRGILMMLCTIVFMIHLYHENIHKVPDRRRSVARNSIVVFFYSLIFPILLVLYAVLIKDISFKIAFNDVRYLLPLLLYYPISRLLKSDSGIFLGWVIAISVTHTIISLILSIGPLEITSIIYNNYCNLISDEETILENLVEGIGIIRITSPAFIASLFGFFIGFLITIDSKKKLFLRFFGFAFSLLSLSPLIVSYFRGPLIATAIILLLFGFAAILKQHFDPFAFRTSVYVFAVMLIGGYAIYLIVPEGYYHILYTGSFQSYIGEQRLEQSEKMIEAFKEEPILGQGVGSVVRGYGRSVDGLNFELQYHMFLFRLGMVGFILLMAPLIWLFAELIRKKGVISKRLFQIEGKFHVSLLLSILATFIAGWANPYLKTGYLTLSIAMYLSYKDVLLEQHF
jgi:hypothetical protein